METLIHTPNGALENADPWHEGRRVRMKTNGGEDSRRMGGYDRSWIGKTATIRTHPHPHPYQYRKREDGYVYVHWDQDSPGELRFVHKDCLEFI